MSEDDLHALTEDIAKHGQREPGVTLDGMVLDGWHRYLACDQLGFRFATEEFQGTDPVAYVLSKNLHRRHLTASQRAASIVGATNWRPTGVQSGMVAPGATMTNQQMAKEAEVSPRTIRQAKTAHTAGLGDAVKDGQVSAKDAARLARGDAPKPPKEKKPADAEVANLKARVEELTEQRDNLSETCREQEDKLTMFAATEPDEQQQAIAKLQKLCQRKDAEIARLTAERNRVQDKCNQLIRQVKALEKAQR